MFVVQKMSSLVICGEPETVFLRQELSLFSRFE